MKKFLSLFLCFSLVSLSGCGTIHAIFNKNGKEEKIEATSRAKIVNTEKQISQNDTQKIKEISGLAFGTDYALSKINAPSKEVQVAKEVNQRVMSLAGTPELEQMKLMQKTIDDLISALQKSQEEGMKLLSDKDKEISAIEKDAAVLQQQKESEIQKYMVTAKTAAELSDTYKTELNSYTGWFGLKAVFKGLWQFGKSCFWFLIIGGIIFLVLRMAASANPVCGAIFGLFEQVVSWGVKAIQYAFPKAISLAGYVAQGTYNTVKETLTKTVDAIETAKTKGVDVTPITNETAVSMDASHKAVVADVKKSLNYTA